MHKRLAHPWAKRIAVAITLNNRKKGACNAPLRFLAFVDYFDFVAVCFFFSGVIIVFRFC